MKNVKLLFLAAIILFVSCGEGLFDFSNRNVNPPAIVKPEVKCFEEENAILIYWDKDDSADEYYLWRCSSDNWDGSYTLCYHGTGCSFEDTGLENKKYFYRLQKRRAETLFPATSGAFTRAATAMGVAGPVIHDEYEDNNQKENAVQLFDIINANLYFFCDTIGNVVEDVDWYKITINPRRRVKLKVICDSNSDIRSTEIEYSKGNEMEYIPIGSGNDAIIELDNPSWGPEPATVYFRVRLDQSQFDSTTGAIGSYQIQFVSETNMGG